MLLLLFFSRAKAEERTGVLKRLFNDKELIIEVSGSSYQTINGTKQLTKPEYAVYPWDKSYDWCSNCAHSYSRMPYITLYSNTKKIRFNSYFIRAGCCNERKCCCEDGYYSCFDCCLYSWSLQISDDNKTWSTVHKVNKDTEMCRCKEKTYTLDQEYNSKYVRLIQNGAIPGYPPCISINKIELFGSSLKLGQDFNDDIIDSYHDDDEDISIIGHISKNSKD